MTTTHNDDDARATSRASTPTLWHSKRTNDEYIPNGPIPIDTFKTGRLLLCFQTDQKRIIVFKTVAEIVHDAAPTTGDDDDDDDIAR